MKAANCHLRIDNLYVIPQSKSKRNTSRRFDMTKIVMLAVVLLASAAWLQAQQYPPDTSKQTGSSQNKIEGCLQGSDGNFTLTDSSGTTYQLQGDTAKLTEHVGHEVQITGSTSRGGDSANSASAGAASQPSLNVKSIKHVSKTCKSTNK